MNKIDYYCCKENLILDRQKRTFVQFIGHKYNLVHIPYILYKEKKIKFKKDIIFASSLL
jgi:hypothetical protein